MEWYVLTEISETGEKKLFMSNFLQFRRDLKVTLWMDMESPITNKNGLLFKTEKKLSSINTLKRRKAAGLESLPAELFCGESEMFLMNWKKGMMVKIARK